MFVFQNKGANSKVDVEAMDVYFKLTSTSTQPMNKKVPRRGGREKILIEALTHLASIVLDAYTSTCRQFFVLRSSCCKIFIVSLFVAFAIS